MNILIVGRGGREHALAYRASLSPSATKVFVAPGNAGMALESKISCVDIHESNLNGLLEFAQNNSVGLTIVGPEAPLSEGIVDLFEENGQSIFGPSQACAQLESSKSYAKEFLKKYAIPTADYETFTSIEKAEQYIDEKGAPIVVKADGLAAGKGVIVAETVEQAKAAVNDMLEGNAFGDAGSKVVIEEFLEGEEASFIVMCDGDSALPLATSQDHKRALEGDRGPNTGGMGAYSPAPVVSQTVHNRVMDEIINPTLEGMKSEGHRYKGFLYAGLMIDSDGNPKVIEFNCRCGDPETQPIMYRMESDLVELSSQAASGAFSSNEIQFDENVAIGVVLASEGYPGSYTKGHQISGLPTIVSSNVKVFHAATKSDGNDLITDGGRVLCVTAKGKTLNEAQKEAYQAVNMVEWEGMQFRRDIGHRALK